MYAGALNRPSSSRSFIGDRNAPTGCAPRVMRAGRLRMRFCSSDGLICRRRSLSPETDRIWVTAHNNLRSSRRTIKRNSHEVFDSVFSGTHRAGFERVRQTDCRDSCGGGCSSRPGAGRPDRRHRIERTTDDHLTGRVRRSLSSGRNAGNFSRFAHQFAEQSESTRGHDQAGGVHGNAKAGSGGRRIIPSIAPAQVILPGGTAAFERSLFIYTTGYYRPKGVPRGLGGE